MSLGRHACGIFFSYADNVTLLAPTSMALNAMLDIHVCTRFAYAHNLLLKLFKPKYMFFLVEQLTITQYDCT